MGAFAIVHCSAERGCERDGTLKYTSCQLFIKHPAPISMACLSIDAESLHFDGIIPFNPHLKQYVWILPPLTKIRKHKPW